MYMNFLSDFLLLQVSLFIFNPNVPTEQRPVEAWVIVVPIIIVLLVMGVVIAILWVVSTNNFSVQSKAIYGSLA